MAELPANAAERAEKLVLHCWDPQVCMAFMKDVLVWLRETVQEENVFMVLCYHGSEANDELMLVPAAPELHQLVDPSLLIQEQQQSPSALPASTVDDVASRSTIQPSTEQSSECPNNGYNAVVGAPALVEHRTDCGREKVECAHDGAQTAILRDEVENHGNAQLRQHLALINAELRKERAAREEQRVEFMTALHTQRTEIVQQLTTAFRAEMAAHQQTPTAAASQPQESTWENSCFPAFADALAPSPQMLLQRDSPMLAGCPVLPHLLLRRASPMMQESELEDTLVPPQLLLRRASPMMQETDLADNLVPMQVFHRRASPLPQKSEECQQP